MKIFNFLPIIVLFSSAHLVHSAPEILTYSGKMSVSGQPYNGTAELKIALVNRTGTFSYWTNDGNFTTPQEPAQAISVNVSNGIYTVRLGDTSITNMQALPGSYFRIITMLIYASGYAWEARVILKCFPRPGNSPPLFPWWEWFIKRLLLRSVSNGSGSSGYTVSNPQSIGSATVGAYARLVANGPSQPSATSFYSPVILQILLLTTPINPVVWNMPLGPIPSPFPKPANPWPIKNSGWSRFRPSGRTYRDQECSYLTSQTGRRARSHKIGRCPAPPAEGQNPGNAPPPSYPFPVPVRSPVGEPLLYSSLPPEKTYLSMEKERSEYCGSDLFRLTSGKCHRCGCRPICCPGDQSEWYGIQPGHHGDRKDARLFPPGCTGLTIPRATPVTKFLTSFSIDQHEVTKAFWDEVYIWAIANGYDFSNAGIAEGPEYPVHSINWYDCVKWANALSERDGHTPCYYTDNNCTVIYRAGQVDLTNYNVKWNANGYRLTHRDGMGSGGPGRTGRFQIRLGRISLHHACQFRPDPARGHHPGRFFPRQRLWFV